jgi:F420-dependent oxidoreductase-like protein
VRISASLAYGGDHREAVAVARRYEEMGLDMVWVPEVYTFDSVSLLGAIAEATERIELGSAILPLYSRTPTMIAMTAAGLDSVSEGRFTLGLGVSGPQVIEGWHGSTYDDPLGRTRETVEICRKVWRREVLTHEGPNHPIPLPGGTGLGKPLKLINSPVRDRIPIYLASIGPRNVALTAEIAEGWLPAFFHPDKADDVWGSDLRVGLSARDPQLGPLQVVVGCAAALCSTDEAPALRDLARGRTALYIGGMGAKGHNFYNALFARYGYEQEAEVIQDLYLSGHKAEAEAAVPDDFLRDVHLVGDRAFLADRLAAFAAAGVTMLDVSLVGPDPLGTLTALRSLTE